VLHGDVVLDSRGKVGDGTEGVRCFGIKNVRTCFMVMECSIAAAKSVMVENQSGCFDARIVRACFMVKSAQ
jgi:hypothetical protein